MEENEEQRQNKGWSNLQPCKPGETHNPNGRPKGSISLTELAKKHLREHPEQATEIITNWIKRSGRSISDLAHLLDRTDGSVPQKVLTDKVLAKGKLIGEIITKFVPDDLRDQCLIEVEKVFTDEE